MNERYKRAGQCTENIPYCGQQISDQKSGYGLRERLQCRSYILPERKLSEHVFECSLHRRERAGYRGCGLLGRRTRDIQLSLYYMNSGVNVAQIIDVIFYSGDFLCVSQQTLHFSFCAAIPEL